MDNFINKIKGNGIIAAVREQEKLKEAINSNVSTIFILSGNIFNVKEMVDEVKKCNKSVFLHLDFIDGLASDVTALEYVSKVIKPTGIITTKPVAIKHANTIKLPAIQRFFLIDSQSYITMSKTILQTKPLIIEVMPGLMPEIIKKTKDNLNVNVIAGGLIENKKDIINAINAGAIAGSTGNPNLWNI